IWRGLRRLGLGFRSGPGFLSVLPFHFFDGLPDDLLMRLERAPQLAQGLDGNQEYAFLGVDELELGPLLEAVLLPDLCRDGYHALAGDCRDLAQKSAHHVNGGGTMQLSVSHCSTRFGPSWAALVSCLGTRRRPCTGGPGFLSSGIRDPRPRRH